MYGTDSLLSKIIFQFVSQLMTLPPKSSLLISQKSYCQQKKGQCLCWVGKISCFILPPTEYIASFSFKPGKINTSQEVNAM